jgi:hypothetical protein
MNKQSFDSEKFSAAGITVTTANPIYYNVIQESPQDWYLSLDASSSSSDVAAFQSYAKSKGADLGNGGVDGKWSDSTSAAWKQYGDQYLASLNQANTQPTTTNQPTPEQIAVAKKNGFDWNSVTKKFEKFKESGALDAVLSLFGLGKKPDEAPTDNKLKNPDKGMSTGAKIAIGVGAAIVLGVIVYTATKKSK